MTNRSGEPRRSILLLLPLICTAASCATPGVQAPRSPLAIANTRVPSPDAAVEGTADVDSGESAIAESTASEAASGTLVPVATVLPPPPEALELPPGFALGVFADIGLPLAMMAVAPNGDVFASVPTEDRIIVLPDRDGDGQVDALPTGTEDRAIVFAEGRGLRRPWGLAFGADALYVAANDALWRYAYRPGQLQASSEPDQISDLPEGDFNWERGLSIGPDGRLYVTVGAPCVHCAPEEPRAAGVLVFDPAGGAAQLFSTGLYRALDLAFHPRTGEAWVGDQGRLGLGDSLPREEINRLAAGAHFGWPACHGDRQPDSPADVGAAAGFCARTTGPMAELEAHGGISGLLFYTGSQFPVEYRGDLYVAVHGSDASRELPSGYHVLRLPMDGDQPRGEIFDFVSGWLRPDTRRWGSPLDLALARDGALLISDDRGGRVYRVVSTMPSPTPTETSP